MSKLLFSSSLILTLAFSITACSKSTENETKEAVPEITTTSEPPQTTTESSDSLIRHAEQPTSAPTPVVLGEIPMGKGKLQLQSVKVTGKILTVKVIAQPNPAPNQKTEFMSTSVNLEQTNYIDDETAKKVGLLQDDSGAWMAAPIDSGDNKIIKSTYDPFLLTFKFPAPPETTKTISINLGNAGSFDGIQVER